MKKKRRISFSTVYLALGLVIIYLPIALVILYSFNESKLSSVWGGFSLKWYLTLFADKAMFQALGNSLILGLSAGFAAGVVIAWKPKENVDAFLKKTEM